MRSCNLVASSLFSTINLSFPSQLENLLPFSKTALGNEGEGGRGFKYLNKRGGFESKYSGERPKSPPNKLCLNTVFRAETHESGLYLRTLGWRLRSFTTVGVIFTSFFNTHSSGNGKLAKSFVGSGPNFSFIGHKQLEISKHFGKFDWEASDRISILSLLRCGTKQ